MLILPPPPSETPPLPPPVFLSKTGKLRLYRECLAVESAARISRSAWSWSSYLLRLETLLENSL